MGKTPLQLAGEALRDSFPQGSSRFWQGRRARGRQQVLARESGGEDTRFGKATFPLAPPLPRGYTKGGGGVAGVADFDPSKPDMAEREMNLTNAERAWLTDHDMPLGTVNRIVVLRSIQQWDAEVAARLSSELKKGFVTTGERSSSPMSQLPISAACSTNSWMSKRAARRRPNK